MGVATRCSSAARSTHEACDLSGDHKGDPAQVPAGLGAVMVAEVGVGSCRARQSLNLRSRSGSRRGRQRTVPTILPAEGNEGSPAQVATMKLGG
jgi:hypothetical protein